MHSNDTNKKIIYPELSYKLTGIFFDIHNNLGRNLLEKQYADAFEAVLKELKIPYQREVTVSIEYKGQKISAGRIDFIVDNKIGVDFKTKKFLTKNDYYQMLRYLKANNFHLGLIVNFRNTYLKPKRIINNDFKTK